MPSGGESWASGGRKIGATALTGFWRVFREQDRKHEELLMSGFLLAFAANERHGEH